ncbi:MAG: 6-carboxytetrahydropterin synthase [Pseudomonadota bacterium]
MFRLFVEQLTTVDFTYFDSDRGLLGQTYIVDVTLIGDLNPEYMMIDFGLIKKRLKSEIELLLDHKFWLFKPAVKIEKNDPQNFHIQMNSKIGLYYLTCPKSAVFFDLSERTLSLDLAKNHLEQQMLLFLQSKFPNIKALEIDLYLEEQKSNEAFFQYCHGLKTHNGDCQRIAHGHRSKIQIWLDSNYSEVLSREWANFLDGRFIANAEDEIVTQKTNSRVFQYEAPQGVFYLEVPSDRVWIIEGETTIENITYNIARYLLNNHKNKKIKIRTYEGTRKGAEVIL